MEQLIFVAALGLIMFSTSFLCKKVFAVATARILLAKAYKTTGLYPRSEAEMNENEAKAIKEVEKRIF